MSVTAELTEYRRSRSPERLFDDQPTRGWEGRPGTRRLKLDGEGGESTLDELLAGVWERLTVHAVAICPLCDGELDRVHPGQIPGAVRRGRCRDCGTILS